MNYNNFPEQLRNQKHWVLWKKETVKDKITKVPYKNTAQKASSTNSKDWRTFEECKEFMKTNQFDGLGYVFTKNIVGIDLDHCFTEEGVLKEWAKNIIDLFPSYVEYSPSKKGLHIILACEVEFKGAKTYIEDGDVERYCRERYFTVTGNVYEGYKTMKKYEAEFFLQWHNSLIKEKPKPLKKIATDNLIPDDSKILEKMFGSKNGQKLKDLYTGNWQKHFKEKSQSEADLSLISYLMFFCRNNIVTVDRIYRSSGLMREKWNRQDIRDGMFQKCFKAEVMDWKIEYKLEHKITSLNEVLKMEEVEEPFLLQGMIVEGAINALTSDSGKGKSLLMLKMIEAIAEGEKFLNKFETKKSKILIIDLEMSKNDIIQRSKSIIGKEIEGIDFHFAQTFNILNNEDFNWLKKAIENNQYKLVVLDTYSMMAQSKSENDNAEANIVNKRMLELINGLNITILFLHHHRKLQKGEVMTQSTSRGATDIIGKTASHLLIDTRDVIIVNEQGGLKGINISVEQMKRRQAIGIEKFDVKVWYNPFEKNTYFEFGGYDQKEKNAVEKTKIIILNKMEAGQEYMMKDIIEMTGKDSHCVYTAIKELVELDKIVRFRHPQDNEKLESGRKIPIHSKIYYLEDKKDASEGMEGVVG